MAEPPVKSSNLDYTEVCSAPRLILTLLELDSELMDGLSRRDVFFRLDRNGPWPLPEMANKCLDGLDDNVLHLIIAYAHEPGYPYTTDRL